MNEVEFWRPATTEFGFWPPFQENMSKVATAHSTAAELWDIVNKIKRFSIMPLPLQL